MTITDKIAALEPINSAWYGMSTPIVSAEKYDALDARLRLCAEVLDRAYSAPLDPQFWTGDARALLARLKQEGLA